MEVEDLENIIVSPKTEEFIKGHFNGFDLRKMDSFVIGWLEQGDSVGFCRRNEDGNYNILIRLSKDEKYPQTIKIKQENGNFSVKVNNEEELAVFYCFHESFHFLSLTGQFCKEDIIRNSEINANIHARIMLNKFKLVNIE